VPAFRPIRPAAPGPGPGARRSLLASLSFLAFAAPAVVAACAGAATPRPSIPADATGSLLPPATATAAASPTASAGPTFPLTLTDDEGTAVELKAEPRKIVSLTAAPSPLGIPQPGMVRRPWSRRAKPRPKRDARSDAGTSGAAPIRPVENYRGA
jgi:ABC-type Fe3+-hydroxamate transport system substrate-binding protein